MQRIKLRGVGLGSAVVLNLVVGCLGAEEFEGRLRLGMAMESFSVGGIDEAHKDAFREVGTLLPSGIRYSGSVTTDPSYGFRVSWLSPLQDIRGGRWGDWGASVGFVVAPSVIDRITIENILITAKTKTMFKRLLVEVKQRVPVARSFGFNLGAGLGIAFGEIESQINSQFFDQSASDSWNGFTWEVSPSIVLERSYDFELGLRYAQFPKKGETNDLPPVKWNPWAFFAAIHF